MLLLSVASMNWRYHECWRSERVDLLLAIHSKSMTKSTYLWFDILMWSPFLFCVLSVVSCHTPLAPWLPSSMTRIHVLSYSPGSAPSMGTRHFCTMYWSSQKTVCTTFICMSGHTLLSSSGEQLFICCLPSHSLQFKKADIWTMLRNWTPSFLINKVWFSALPYHRSFSCSLSCSSSTPQMFKQQAGSLQNEE